MPLRGVRVLELSDLEGALCARLLADLGADVVRVEPPGGAAMRGLGPFLGGSEDREAGYAHWYYNTSKRGMVLDPATPDGMAELERLARAADVLIDARPIEEGGLGFPSAQRLREISPSLVVIRFTPFGLFGPRAGWIGSDLVCAARGGMVFVNGHPGEAPIAPFGLVAHAAAGIQGAIAALLALFARERNGQGALVDLSITAAAAAAVEHATSFFRQTGSIESRHGTLHWSRGFRIGECRDGHVMHCLLGDWTSLAEWVASESACEARSSADENRPDLRDPRWDDFEERKRHCEALFDVLDRWSSTRPLAEVVAGAELRRLPYAPVRRAESLASDEQLGARGFAVECTRGALRAVLPGAAFRMSRTPCRAHRPPPLLGEHAAELASDPAWSSTPSDTTSAQERTARHVGPRNERPLDGVRVLDFTWVVAGPYATRILADQGAAVIKVERRNATDFGSRRGGLTGNLNRGKQSIVLDLSDPRGLDLVRRLAARSDVVIDNFSTRVMENWGLDYRALRRLREDVIAVRLTGFGLDGPRRDGVSYGPTLQALVGLPYLMRHSSDERPAGWGYSWSDIAAGMMGALGALAALRDRDRTGEGQLVDLAQLETLAALLGPRVLDLLQGVPVDPSGNSSQQGPAVPHGVYRCAPGRAEDGSMDDERWIAITVLDDAQWHRLAGALASDGETWVLDPALESVALRLSRAAEIDRGMAAWTRALDAEEIEQRLQALGVPAGLVANGRDVSNDPQLCARGYFVTVPTPEGDDVVLDGVPFLSSNLPGGIEAPGPLLGEHTEAILAGVLGLSAGEIADLREEGVIA